MIDAEILKKTNTWKIKRIRDISTTIEAYDRRFCRSHISRKTLYRWCVSGKVKAMRIGKMFYIDYDEFIKYMGHIHKKKEVKKHFESKEVVMLSINEIVKIIKNVDKDTSLNYYILRFLAESNKVKKVILSNKILFDVNELFSLAFDNIGEEDGYNIKA